MPVFAGRTESNMAEATADAAEEGQVVRDSADVLDTEALAYQETTAGPDDISPHNTGVIRDNELSVPHDDEGTERPTSGRHVDHPADSACMRISRLRTARRLREPVAASRCTCRAQRQLHALGAKQAGLAVHSQHTSFATAVCNQGRNPPIIREAVRPHDASHGWQRKAES